MLMLPWLIKKHQKYKPFVRALTDGETALAKTVFGDLVDYERVRIVDYPYVPWQADDVFIAPNGWIFVGKKHHQDDFSAAGAMYKQVFIHEMTHVFQCQQGVCVLLKGAWLQSAYYLSGFRYNPYRYTFDENKNFWQYNIEQQGKICEDIWLGKIPNIVSPKNATSVCPHDDCRRTFYLADCHQGVMFCPHCHKSVLMETLPDGVGFGTFALLIAKRNGWLYLGVAFGWMLLWQLLDGWSHWFATIQIFVGGLLVAVVGLMAWLLWTDIQQQKQVSANKKPITNPIRQGVDSLMQVKDDDKIGAALATLADIFRPSVPHCPHCYSQRIHKHQEHYRCHNCQQTLVVNRRLSVQAEICFLLYALMFVFLPLLISAVFVRVFVVLILVIIIHIVSAYWHFCTPKWQNL